ncbi:MAG: NAD(P)-dependent oxidoreductase [Bryobacteraceae bacterium]|nr:NAD(P)-dependent oxidoreductase [Bryobacteraceae bacterium]
MSHTSSTATHRFRVGVSPDFFRDAKGKFERAIEQHLVPAEIDWEPMPDLPGDIATPEALNRYDAVFALALRVTQESVVGVDRLALVARWGVGYDKIDVTALTGAGIALAITPDAVRTPVAEAILTLILALAKNLLIQDRITREGKWRGDLPRMGRNLRGSTIGSVGLGNIGSEMFRLARPFGFARMIAYDPYARPELAADLRVELTDLDTVLRESDFVTINCLLNDSTRGLIGERELKLMKPTSYLINTARGPVIQEDALIRALTERWIAGAGLDVYDQEPPPADHPLFRLENAIVTPHGLPWTEELARDNSAEACRNILAVARGEAPGGLVNRQVASDPRFMAKLEAYKNRSN